VQPNDCHVRDQASAYSTVDGLRQQEPVDYNTSFVTITNKDSLLLLLLLKKTCGKWRHEKQKISETKPKLRTPETRAGGL